MVEKKIFSYFLVLYFIHFSLSKCPVTNCVMNWENGENLRPKPLIFYSKGGERDYFCIKGEICKNWVNFFSYIYLTPEITNNFKKFGLKTQELLSININKYNNQTWERNWRQSTCFNETNPFVDVKFPFKRKRIKNSQVELCAEIPHTIYDLERLSFPDEFNSSQVGKVYKHNPSQICPSKLCYTTNLYGYYAHAIDIEKEKDSWSSIISNAVGTVCYDLVYEVNTIPQGYTLRNVENGYIDRYFFILMHIHAPSHVGYVPNSVKITSINIEMGLTYKIDGKILKMYLISKHESYRVDVNLEFQWKEQECPGILNSTCIITNRMMKTQFSAQRGGGRIDRRFPQFTQTYIGSELNPFQEISSLITNYRPYFGIVHTTNSEIAKGFKSSFQRVKACPIKCGATSEEDVIILNNEVVSNSLTKKVKTRIFTNQEMGKLGFPHASLGYGQDSAMSRLFDIYSQWEFQVTIRYDKRDSTSQNDFLTETIQLTIKADASQVVKDNTSIIIASSIIGGSIIISTIFVLLFIGIVLFIYRRKINILFQNYSYKQIEDK